MNDGLEGAPHPRQIVCVGLGLLAAPALRMNIRHEVCEAFGDGRHA